MSKSQLSTQYVQVANTCEYQTGSVTACTSLMMSAVWRCRPIHLGAAWQRVMFRRPCDVALDTGPGPPQRGYLGSEPSVRSNAAYCQITLVYVWHSRPNYIDISSWKTSFRVCYYNQSKGKRIAKPHICPWWRTNHPLSPRIHSFHVPVRCFLATCIHVSHRSVSTLSPSITVAPYI